MTLLLTLLLRCAGDVGDLLPLACTVDVGAGEWELLFVCVGMARGVRSSAPCDASDMERAGELVRVEHWRGAVLGLVGAEFTEFALLAVECGRGVVFTTPLASIRNFCSKSRPLKSSLDLGRSLTSKSCALDMCSDDMSSS